MMHRAAAVSGQIQAAAASSLIVKRCVASNAAMSALESMLAKPNIERAVGEELRIERSATTKVLHIELNRPKKLNALSFNQIQYLANLFPLIHKSPVEHCSAVVLTGSGSKAFCAGGDIKELTETMNLDLCETFFSHEYCMDLWMAALNRPLVSLWNGVTFGGGVGLSIYGKYRIATDTTLFAMPETAIGFFPDVGASYFYSRLKHGVGLYLGLTGARLNAADVLELGLATHYIKKEQIEGFMQQLMVGGDGFGTEGNRSDASVNYLEESALERLLGSLHSTPAINPTLTLEVRQQIRRFFDGIQTPKELSERLAAGVKENNKFAIESKNTIEKFCPLSCAIWIELNNKGPSLSLQQSLSLDYQLSQSLFSNDPHYNFKEGVRAVLIDRCGEPKWNPESLSDVTPEEVYSHMNYTKCKQLLAVPGLIFPTEKELKKRFSS